MDYNLFVRNYKDKIRPDDQLNTLKTAFRLDAEFTSQFNILRQILKHSQIVWGKEIVMALLREKALPPDIGERELDKVMRLYARHQRLFRIGEFSEHYLDSIEDVALDFIHHDVKTIWIAGAYRDLTGHLIDVVLTTKDPVPSLLVIPSMKALTLALSVELNQIQRVYTMYERGVSDSLIKDLSCAGMMTNMPTGRRKTKPPTKE